MKGAKMSLTRALAEMALQPRSEDIPEAAYDAVRLLVLDTMGVTIGGYKNRGGPPGNLEKGGRGGEPGAALPIFWGEGPPPPPAPSHNAIFLPPGP